MATDRGLARSTSLAAALVLLSLSSHAESFRAVYESSSGTYLGVPSNTTHFVDFDSVEPVGDFLRYRVRTVGRGGTTNQFMVSNCSESTRGQWIDMRMYPAYPGTLSGDELQAVCEFSRSGKLPFEIAKPTEPSPAGESPATVAKATPKRLQLSSSGSGFLVAAKYLVTNNHVVEGCASVDVRHGDVNQNAVVKAASVVSDLALLVVEKPIGAGASIRATAMLGEDVMVAGHPLAGLLSNDIVVTAGQVNSLAGLLNDPQLFQFSAPMQPGNSGGPLLDRSGFVVGVAVSKVNVLKLEKMTGDLAQNVNFAIKPEILRLFLDTNRVIY